MRANITNYGNSTLLNPIGNSDTSFILVSGGGSKFPVVNASTPDYFIVSIDQELVLCSARSVDTFTVSQRGYEGTPAVSHSAGAPVVHSVTAGVQMRIWSDLPDAYSPDTATFTRGLTAQTWDDDFEEAAGNVSTAGNWTFAPNDSGQTHSFGTNYRSMFDFHRADSSGGSYFLYQAFSRTGAFTVTAKLSHGGSFSLPNEYQASLFVSDNATPSSSQEGGYRARVDSVISAAVSSIETLPWTGNPTAQTFPRLMAVRGSYDSNGTWAPMTTAWGGISVSPMQGQIYLSLSYDGSAIWNAWAGDGYTYQHLGYISNTFIPASLGFRFYADHAPTGQAYNHCLVDWIRVSLSDRAVYNSLIA